VEGLFHHMEMIDTRQALADALSRARFEILPFERIEESVLEHVPRDLKLTVTVSPTRGLEPTLDLAVRLAGRGYRVAPHLAARLVRDEAHLDEILGRLEGAGVREVFVVAGDAREPAGSFQGAHALLEAMAERGHALDAVGITGYPESHPFISDEETIQAMFDKQPFADYIVSQISFDPNVIGGWIDRVRRRGTHLPIYLGLPGKVDRRKLVRISARIGVGESVRFLRKQAGWLSHLIAPGGYRPDRLLEQLAPYVADPRANVPGFHVYTFNEVGPTERWRRETIEQLADDEPSRPRARRDALRRRGRT
jgi:methylenetetrahydrofolate reductase (NADPH)